MNLLILTMGTDTAFEGLRKIILSYSRPGKTQDIIKYILTSKRYYTPIQAVVEELTWMSNFNQCWNKLLQEKIIIKIGQNVRISK